MVNGDDNHTFIAIFRCDHTHNQWQLTHYFANNTIEGLIHPYGISWYSKNQWYVITAQNPDFVFILDISYEIIEKIQARSTMNTNQSDHKGLRGVAVDNDMDLIFIASPDTNNVLIFDIENEFNNTYNITLSNEDETEPISVLIDENVLYVTDRLNSKIYAFHYSKNSYYLKWISTDYVWMQQPTGLALNGNSLFVISQTFDKILVYNIKNGLYKGEFANWRTSLTGIDQGEQLLFVNSHSDCAVK